MGLSRALLIGNSDGIGLGVTKHLIRADWSVTGISRSALDEAAIAGDRGDYKHIICNVLNPGYKQSLVAVWADRGPFDLVVHLVGVGYGLEQREFNREAETFRANLVSLVETVEVVMPEFLAVGSGHLMGLSSIADDILMAEAPSYGASKAGYSTYLNSLALGHKKHGIAVTNVRFGFVDTKMAKGDLRPFMISVDRAAKVLMRCVHKRPMQMTYPKTMGAVVRVLRKLQSLRIWFGV